MNKPYRRHTARGIVIKDNRLLLFERWRRHHEDGRPMHYYSIPGGGIEKGETPEEALIREMKEEMTVGVAIDRLLVRQTTPDRYHYYFLCHIENGEPVFNLSSEEARNSSRPQDQYRVAWLPLSQASYKLRHPEHTQALEQAMKLLQDKTALPIDITFEKSYTRL